ncbi:MAG: macro domain-containing protein [Thermoguttaceae bacterium]|nr:macro domain-containing protein [Thermoguttaceae bacterium]
MPIFDIVTADITTFKADAIVNAANTLLQGRGGVDGAIHRAAGPRLREYCRTLNGCETGMAKITPAFDMTTTRYIIHTPGPRFSKAKAERCDALLASSYLSSLKVAEGHGVKTIAFPSISTGIFHFPLDRAALVVAKTLLVYKMQGGAVERVTMVCFDVPTAQAYEAAFATVGLFEETRPKLELRKQL